MSISEWADTMRKNINRQYNFMKKQRIIKIIIKKMAEES